MMREYKIGEVIVDKCVPIAKFLSIEYRQTHCNNCFLPEPKVQCKICHQLSYCDDRCAEEDWLNGHYHECNSVCFREYCHTGDGVVGKVLLFRMYALLRIKPFYKEIKIPLPNGTSKCFQDLLDNQKIQDKGVENSQVCKTMAEMVKLEWPKSELTTLDFQALHGIQLTNCIPLLDPSRRFLLGWGIYIEQSAFRLSCQPTALYLNIGQTTQVRAISHIAAGEIPLISQCNSALVKDHYGCEVCLNAPGPSASGALLHDLVVKMNWIEIATTKKAPKNMAWSEIQILHKEILEKLRQLYHEHDQRITNHFDNVFTIGVNLQVYEMDPAMKTIQDETLKHLIITYGEDHPKLHEFNRKSLQLLYSSLSLRAATSIGRPWHCRPTLADRT